MAKNEIDRGIKVEDLPELEAAISEIKDLIQPSGSRKEKAILINRLLLHYPVKNMSPEMNTLVAQDWLEDLEEFPLWAVQSACKEYRRGHRYKPTINEVRGYCLSIIAKYKSKIFSMKLVLKDAEMKARIDAEWKTKIDAMKADGSWETIKANFYERVK